MNDSDGSCDTVERQRQNSYSGIRPITRHQENNRI